LEGSELIRLLVKLARRYDGRAGVHSAASAVSFFSGSVVSAATWPEKEGFCKMEARDDVHLLRNISRTSPLLMLKLYIASH
jgi:hypothetical protein